MTLPNSRVLSPSRALAALLIVQFVLGCVYLGTVPRIFNDEPWEASLGHSLAYEGTLAHGIIEGWGGMHIHFVQNQVVMPFVCAAMYKLAGFGIVTSRLASVLMSLEAVAGVYGVMRYWFGWRIAFWIAAAAMLHPWFWEITRRVRPEIYYLALAMAAWWLWLIAVGQRSVWPAVGAGICAALAGLAHPTGALLVLAIAGAMLIWLPEHRQWKLAVAVAGGVLLAAVPYALYVLWAIRDPQVSFLQQMRGGNQVFSFNLIHLAGIEARRWWGFFQGKLGLPLAAVLVSAWLAAWWRTGRYEKAIATSIVLFALMLPFTTVNGTQRYLIVLVPMFAALTVLLIVRLWQAIDPKWPRRVVVGSVGAIYLGTCLGGIGLMLYRQHDADLTRVLDRIGQVTGPDARVVGQMLFWMGEPRYRFGPFPLDERWNQTVEMLERYDFDYAIRSASFHTSWGIGTPPPLPDFRPKEAIDHLCRARGTLVSRFRDPAFGDIEIYRLK